MVSTKYFCQKCGRELKADQKPCPFCGSINRDIKVTIEEKIVARETLRVRQKRKGFGRFIKENIQGWFPSRDKRKHAEGVEKTRVIDKQKDSYQEKIKDVKTGEIVRDIKEPLSQHK
jgi:DNA replicative helicase MCM subunit Mcm2 (Cdc46/Mcm family)